MTNFSKTLIPCAKIGQLIGNSEAYQKMLYDKLCNDLAEEQAKYDSYDDRIKSMKKGQNKLESIEKIKVAIAEAEPTKDEFTLSPGFKTFLKEIYAYAKYNKWSVVEGTPNQYTSKGQIVENLSIELINRLDGRQLVKNKEKLSNHFLVGIPDTFEGESIFDAQYIIDVKSSWDIRSFFDVLDKTLNPNYWWQMQGYFALTGASEGEVSYCLISTPESLINEQKQRVQRNMQPITDQDWIELGNIEKEIEANLSFDDIPEVQRRIKFNVRRDEAAIAKIYEKVDLCRKYLADIEHLHLNPEAWQRDMLPTSE